MTSPKELYKTLAADFSAEKKFYFDDRGEDMMQAREKGTDRIILVNNKTKEAWELISSNGKFSFWDASAVEIASAFDLPYKSHRNAVELRAPYYFGINEFKYGVASVSWTLQPDGRFYADENGFGMEKDEEINYYAFINAQADILVPFQPMDDSLIERYRKQAIAISRNREEIPYICLSPEMTVPVSENTNLAAHREKLLKIIYGMMFQFSSQINNAYKHDDFDGRSGIFTAINLTPEHYLSMTILGDAVEGEDDKYELTLVTALFKQDEKPQACCTQMGAFNTAEIENIMNNEDNARIILNDLLDSVRLIYFGTIPKPK